MADKLNSTHVTETQGGLHLDTTPQNQPKGTYRFALNIINETNIGAEYFRSNEESNEACSYLKPDFVLIGKVYKVNNETIIFSVSKDNLISEIGILDNACGYTVHVNDEDSPADKKLGFKVEKQIQGRYRLRLGCEHAVYFTDDENKPRYFNFSKPEDFKDDDGNWDARKFNLIKEYELTPLFQTINVLNVGGNLLPGSYDVAVQYVDAGLNPTEWITVSHTIKIYNDSLNNSFETTNGSINSETDYLNFGNTNKAIEVVLSNLDDSFSFYRLAFIEANNGSGLVNGVKYTDIIPVSNTRFIYTGENAVAQGTKEEIAIFNDIIDRASHIEQLENRLLLANVKGKNINFCKLQQYASRIKADCVLREVVLNSKEHAGNIKNPMLDIEGMGYMPGEIYSFAIVYLFADGSLSPAYHIPGKNRTVPADYVYSPGANVKPMSNNNQSLNNRYFDNDTCANSNYWSLDADGIPLEGTLVRHHRFPKRSELQIPLVEELSSDSNQTELYRLKVHLQGTIQIPKTCPDPPGSCTPNTAPPFVMVIKYTVDSIQHELSYPVLPSNYQDNVNTTYNLNVDVFGPIHTDNGIVINSIKEIAEDGTETTIAFGTPSPKNITYTNSIEPYTNTSEVKLYKTNILGIKFSGIELPTLADTNGEEIIGYYIVRNERTRFEKTIIDTAVLTPSVINSKYVSHGLLQPQTSSGRIAKDLFGIISPRHKFMKEELSEFDTIEQEGNFDIVDRKFGKFRYNDVYDGTSFNEEIHKKGELEDEHNSPNLDDGWSLKCILRDNITKFRRKKSFVINNSDKKELFYLNAVQSRDINGGSTTAYNITSDNKVGMLQTKTEVLDITQDTLPYVVVTRTIADSYANFRILPYYKENMNPIFFKNVGTDTAEIFHGDTYVQPMRYTNTVFWDNTVAERAGKTSVWNYVLGGLLVVVGAVLAFFTAGASTLVIGAGIAIIGGGALFIASGIEKDAMVRAYNEEYKRGLRETTLDDWVDRSYVHIPNHPNGPMDDEIRWIGDCITDLWFDTDVNIGLRHKMKSDAPTFLNAPGKIESGNDYTETIKEYFGKYRYWDWTILPVSELEKHVASKLTVFASGRKDSKLYLGAALGEWYEVNPDYHRQNKEKTYYHLALEYDCCSDCKETFVHRWRWSEQSFQEELTDNYRVFLPNNYRDIPGETGEITNMFTINNDLFLHTREALWQVPRNYQERVTDQIISFIGTGSYGEIPPQRIIDDETGNSAGSQHKWATIKTPEGVFFVSENTRKIYQFNGKQLKPISDAGLSNWFQNNISLKLDEQYYKSKRELYPYRDNPSNPFGTGFISGYDTQKKRVLFTKRDYVLGNSVIEDPDFEMCIGNGQVTIFPGFSQIIQNEQANGWNYIGLQDCRMAFERTVIKTRTETREITTTLPNNADIIVHLDMSGSFNDGSRQQIKDAINAWKNSFGAANPDWTGNLYYSIQDGYTSQRCWKILKFIKSSQGIQDVNGNPVNASQLSKNLVAVSFVNENLIGGFGSNICYHPELTNPMGNGASDFYDDYNEFITLYNQHIAGGGTFNALNYPITYATSIANMTEGFVQHVLAVLKGRSYTTGEINSLTINPFMSGGSWSTLIASLQNTNPYPDDGLENYGWKAIEYRGWNGSGDVITAEQFQADMDQFLQGITSTETIEVEVKYTDTEYKFIDGQVVDNPLELNNSWTISYSLKQNHWVSWHTTIPNIYINVPDKLYSWTYGNNTIWKHNKVGSYGLFNNIRRPSVIEYVPVSNPLVTKITDSIDILADFQKYFPENNEFVDLNNIFFNKVILYNSRQCTGELNIKVKDANYDAANYIDQQIENFDSQSIIVDRNERNWSLNHFRDMRTNYEVPIFNSTLPAIQSNYYTDKVLNIASLDYNKDWTEQESFRDKYLAVRFIFDNFADVKFTLNFSLENETISGR